MTYILGWKFGHIAYVVADTALTVINPTKEYAGQAAAKRTTSFGELNVREPERVVSEGALKLLNLDQLAVAFCGDVRIARSVVETLDFNLQAGLSPRDSLQRALLSNAPFDLNRQINLIASIPDSPEPVLLAFNIDGDQEVHEIPDETLVQFGSMPKLYKGLTAFLFRQLSPFKSEPDRLLASALAIIQSYGIHEHLLPEGADGPIVGLSVNPNGIQWQKDIIFILCADLDPMSHMISSIIRDNVHIVQTSLTNGCSYFGNSINDGLGEEWMRRWWDAAFEFTGQGLFDFVLHLNTAARIVTVVEMMKKNESEYFRINTTEREQPGERFRIDMSMHPLLTKAATERLPDHQDGRMPFKFNWFPYRPAQ